MAERGIVLGFYQDSEAASAALKEIGRQHHHRAAAIHYAEDGAISLQSAGTLPAFRLPNTLLDRYKRWLVSNETMVVAQASPDAMGDIVDILRSASSAATTFVILPAPDCVMPPEEEVRHTEPVTIDSLRREAADLAKTVHRMRPPPGRIHRMNGRLRDSEACLRNVHSALSAAVRVGLPVSMSAEWLLDNNYIIEGHIAELRKSLPTRYYEELPIVDEGPDAGLPRVYTIAVTLIADTDTRLDGERIFEFLQAYQSITPLTMGELWALPLMLRLRIIECVKRLALRVELRERERELADFLSNRLLTAARKDRERLIPFMAELSSEYPNPTPHLAEELVSYLFDEETALTALTGWLEYRLGGTIATVTQQEQLDQTTEQVALANAITTLRLFAQFDWRELFESLSGVEAILRADPAGIYPGMDFATRDAYRHAVEKIAKSSKLSEMEVASHATTLAEAGTDELTRHNGYYLLDRGRPALRAAVAGHPRFSDRARRWARRHPGPIYLGGIATITVLMDAALLAAAARAGAGVAIMIVIGLLALLPASEIGVQIINYLVTRLMPPRRVPRMDYKDGIPDEYRTLVVVPMMLLTPESIRDEVEHLEIRYLANHGENLRLGLVSDYSDAPQQHMPEDVEYLDVVVQGIAQLNARYGDDRFYLFHRDRRWSESEHRWMGWERKRGKLEQLNCFLVGAEKVETDIQMRVGSAEGLQGVRFVLTLDADTQLPHDTARHLVETLAHTLNRPRVSADGRTVERGYAIIQPNVLTSLPSATATRFTRFFTDATGIDPYTHTSSDVYQDLVGESSYQGKGIYDLEVFQKLLCARFPESHLLSHDLIEGAHVRVGLASDIELLDQFPANYLSYSKRRHRWIRGDWQIMDWLLPSVPSPTSGREPNPLSAFNRWKIGDNLRRSLWPAASLALIAVAWLASPIPLACTLFVSTVLLLSSIAQVASLLTTKYESGSSVFQNLGRSLLRAVIDLALLPDQACSSLDAITRVWYRRTISHKLLLEWETAQMAQRSARRRERALRRQVWIPAASALMAVALGLFARPAFASAFPFLLTWMFTPLLIAWLDQPMRDGSVGTLSESDRRMLRQVARETWRFFCDFVGPQTNWLPPDNYQADLRVEVAQRTSPTNVGLLLLSNLAASDFGYITLDGTVERTIATLQTMEKLELYEGHLLNWYDIQTLEPLRPRYVSMVDSGNLLGALWAVGEGIHELIDGPIVSLAALRGLEDMLGLLRSDSAAAAFDGTPVEKPLAALENLVLSPPDGIEEIVRRLRAAVTPSCILLKAVNELKSCSDSARYWSQQIDYHVTLWNGLLDRYLQWVEILASPPDGSLLAAGPEAHEWRRQALASIPSLRALARGNVPGLRELVGLQRRKDELNLPPATHAWLNSLEKAASPSQYYAGEQLAAAEDAITRMQHLADATNMRFLYDPAQHLFFTGYNLSDLRMDAGYYNLLASEARLGSFIAVARGEVPAEHWWALGRPFGMAYGHPALLSWGGTMFEYLMPLLLSRNYENSLLDQACKAAVTCQIAYGRQRNIPWGISESSFSAVDAQRTYQYRAFGVPGLGLKRGLEEDLVVTPYATALALAVNPAAAAKNLAKLASIPQLSMRTGYGYYEAIDYTRQESPTGRRGVIVRSYMAHHQGMILGAIDNALNDGILQERFHRDPRVRATESLLFERIPASPAIVKENTQGRGITRLAPMVSAGLSGRIDTPQTATPRTDLLSNGSYSVMVTNAGGGYSQWKGTDITRWTPDSTCDARGSFCYLKDLDSGAVWSSAFQPIRTTAERYSVVFASDKAEIRRRDNDIEVVTEIVVSPGHDVEVRVMTLTNRSRQPRRLELTSYLELALAPRKADRAHLTFSKLFVETEALPDQGALLAFRRPRSASETPIWALHLISGACFDKFVQHETDRALFLGRGRAAGNPAAMEGDLSGSVGAVLDPIFSLRRRINLDPGQRVQIAFVTGAAASREEAVALVEKYCDPPSAHRALEMAWTHAQLELRHMRIFQEDAQAFQQLASYVLYPSALLRPAPERLARNTLGQARLWAYGISGDLPIVVVSIGDTQDIDMVRHVLLAHTYWQARGLKVDLLLLNEEAMSYDQPLQQELRKLVDAHSMTTGVDRPGGVFLRPLGPIPEEERTLLLTVARMVLIAARGSLAHQLGAPQQLGTLPPPLIKNPRIREEPSPGLPFMDLDYFNGLGGFSKGGNESGTEYVIYLGPNDHTPMPWINVMANPSFGALVSESGAGYAWYGNSQTNRLTPWSNDPVSDPGGEALYIRDEDSGVFWSPTPYPIRELDAYRTRHGQGYTVYEHNSHAIEQELTVCVPMDAGGGAPVRLQRLLLRNRSSRRRRLTVTMYCEWVMGTDREDTQMHVRTRWDAQSQCLLARNLYNPDFADNVAFIASNLPIASFGGDRAQFIGRNGTLAKPIGLTRTRLSGRVGAGMDPCGGIQVVVELDPGEQKEAVFMLGEVPGIEEMRALAKRFRANAEFDRALGATRAWWNAMLDTVHIETPDLAVNLLMNRWLLYQDVSCRLFGRSAFYQSGGAYGFRDQLQDVMALVYAAPQLAREQILRTAARQFVEGDVQHWWHPPAGAGVRTQISDDLLWLPLVTAHYVRVTGDTAILDESIPFLEGKKLDAGEHEAYFVPSISDQKGSLLEHCRRSVTRGLTSGPHGLPLMGAGDWNDGLNLVGIGGKGESVWLAWFLVSVLNDFAELLNMHLTVHSPDPEAQKWTEAATKLAATIEAQAWDGEWYLRAFFDDGTPMGSSKSEEAKIDSLPQSWAVISGAADPARAKTAMDKACQELVRENDKMVLLFTPPFDKTSYDPGYIKGYPPGVRENGGQYTHGSLWLPLALALQGEGDRAVAILRMMNPIEHAREPADVGRYKVEPYVAAADVYALAGHVGRGGWTWYSGSAGWMYRVWLEAIVGFHPRGETLTMEPCIAAEWDGLKLQYRYRSAHYEISIENPHHVCRGVESVELDGAPVPDNVIHLQDDGARHTVRVILGS